MEYNIEEYQRKGGKIYDTLDEYKYLSNREKLNCVDLRCVLFKKGCNRTAKLNRDVKLIYSKSEHSHDVEMYKSGGL